MSEANARIIIDKLLRDSDWVLSGDDGVVNVDTEMQNQAGFADYVLKDSSDFPLCVIEAKKELISPLVGTLNPAIIEKVVVLPAPFGPRRPTISPVLISMEISRTTSLLPKVFLKFEANNVKESLNAWKLFLKFQSWQ